MKKHEINTISVGTENGLETLVLITFLLTISMKFTKQSHVLLIPGITLEWDKGMRVYIKLDPVYKGKVCGLCGDYDNKADNDFRSRNDLIEDTALAFANSWKTSQSCPDLTKEPTDPCVLHPERKYWAAYSCNVMMSPAFAPCHAVVSTPFTDSQKCL